MTDSRKDQFRLRTKSYALSIIRLYAELPKARSEVEILGKQLLRSGTSVAANYREASRARSKAEFVSKIETAPKKPMKASCGSNYWTKAAAFTLLASPRC
jgi:predicted patatin/cPLA2 family phospholipase